MNNNDVLRRLRFALDIDDAALVALFALGGREVGEAQVVAWMGREGEYSTDLCDDETLETLLDGLILARRGPPPPGTPPPPRIPLSNNAILKKLRVALSLRDVEMVELIGLGGQTISKAELGGLARPRGHRHFRECGDQILRAFLAGLARRDRGVGPTR